MILSLYWSGLTALGVKCSMIAGFLAVPLFKFVVPLLLSDVWSGYLGALDVLLPAFVVGFVVAIVVSLVDRKGKERLTAVPEELRSASGWFSRDDEAPQGSSDAS